MAYVYITTFIDFSIDDEDLEKIREAFPEHEIIHGSAKEIDAKLKDGIEIIFGYVNPRILSGMKSLKWLHLPWAGVEPYLKMEEIKSGRLKLTNARGVYGPPISEYVIGMFLSLKHNLYLHRDEQGEEIWKPRTPAREFAGSTVGILGFGDVGQTLAKKCKALGTKVIAVKNTPAVKPDYLDELYTADKIDEALPKCDFLALCMPGTEGTAGLLSRERIALLKQGVYIVNVGRGSAIDLGALADALKSGHVAAAGLDVFETEPLPNGHELWHIPNCVITPHTCGRSPQNKERQLKIFLDNLRKYTDTGELDNLISIEKGY